MKRKTAKERIPQPLSNGEFAFAEHCKIYGFEPQREYQFHPTRKWRADFFLEPNILLEIEGGIWIGGRHSRGGKSFEAELEKYNAATLMGFRVLRYSTEQVIAGKAINDVLELLLFEAHK